jgi:ADP-ribose pyrophosphatase
MVKVNHVRTLHRLKKFTLVTENITLSNGFKTDIHILRHPGAAAVVPLTSSGTVILIHQYRHAVRDTIWEIPAGTLDPGETPLECAQRELIEETGFRAASFEKMGSIIPVPAWSDERIHIYLATELAPEEQALEKDEQLDVHEVDLKSVLTMIDNGEINDAKTVAGIQMAYRHLDGTVS